MGCPARIGFGVALALGALLVVGCPDYAPLEVRDAASGGGVGQGGEDGGGGSGGEGGVAWTCDSACAAIYDCGLETVNGAPHCPGFTGGADRDAFVSSCLLDCATDPLFASFVSGGKDCSAIVAGLRSASESFAKRCDGGGGGTGGAMRR